ncbi:MAG: hypothetical protein LBR79_02140 [Oscillospiraceae bacterium]|nr:hypothetical protein [Oscillospiraceae bacterium]
MIISITPAIGWGDRRHFNYFMARPTSLRGEKQKMPPFKKACTISRHYTGRRGGWLPEFRLF